MANHVSAYLSVRNISEEGQVVWDKIVSDLEAKRNENEYEVHLGHFIFENFDDDWDFNRMCDEIGAKWAYMTDADESGMAMYSAWSPCIEFCTYLAEQIGHVDAGVQLALTYEDEFCNFIGCAIFDAGGLEDQSELEGDEFVDMVLEDDDELRAHFDAEEREFDEEGQDMFYEVQWDRISDWQYNTLEAML